MYQLDANNFIMILSHKWPQDHSLNTYGITPHAAVKQHIRTPEDGHVNVRNI